MCSRQLILYFFLLLIFPQDIYNQKDKKVVVTNIKYVLVNNTTHLINTTTFPFYFNDEEFFNIISNTLINNLKEKFGVSKVILMPGTTLEFGTGEKIRKVHPKIPESNNENDIYLGLASFITYDYSPAENIYYKLVTLISASDSRGKSIYKSENTIPFKVRQGKWIPSDTIMNWRDFEYFYIQGIEAAIKGNPKNFGIQTIDHQSAGQYDGFTYNSIKYKVTATQTSYYLVNSDNTKVDILKISEPPNSDLLAEGSFDLIYKFMIENLPEKKKYTLQLYASNDYLDVGNNNINVLIDLISENGETTKFILDQDYNLTAMAEENQIYVYRNWATSVAEFMVDYQLVALLHDVDKQYTLYFSPVTDSGKFGQLCNLIFIYHISTIVMKTAENVVSMQNQF